jgi:ABC-type uncharacterized transport system involved in gliding motility auxiliary subunit
VKGLKTIFGILSAVLILVSLVVYLSVESLLTPAAIGLLGGMVCMLISIAVSFQELSRFFSRHSTRQGLNLFVYALLILAMIGIVEVIASRNNKRFDLTAEKSLSLAPITRKVLRELTRDVKVTVFYQRDQIFEFRDLLKQYGNESNRITYQFFNLDQNPGMAKEYRVASYGGAVVESGAKRKNVTFCTEENITNGIISVTRDKQPVVYFLVGHGESDSESPDKREGYSQARTALTTEGYAVKSLLLVREDAVPADASVVIVNGPRQEIAEGELRSLADYLVRGGRMLFLIDPYTVPGLVSFLKDYNVLVGATMVVDKESKLVAGDVFSPVVPIYAKHPITLDFEVATVFPLVSSVEPMDPPANETVTVKPLALTTEGSWAESNRESIRQGAVYFQEWEDKKGPVSIAVVGEFAAVAKDEAEDKPHTPPPGRMIVVGDSDFANNLYFTVLGNKDFFLNMVGWLAEEEALISIRHKKEQTTPFSPLFLTENQKKLMFWLSTVVLPLLILAIGIVVYARRKLRG